MEFDDLDSMVLESSTLTSTANITVQNIEDGAIQTMTPENSNLSSEKESEIVTQMKNGFLNFPSIYKDILLVTLTALLFFKCLVDRLLSKR